MTAPAPQCQPITGQYHIWQERAPQGPLFVRTPSGGDIFFGSDQASAEQCLNEFATLTARIEYMEATEANKIATLTARVEELETAFRFIADGYDNHDVNHLDYRVKVHQVALDVLEPKGAAV